MSLGEVLHYVSVNTIKTLVGYYMFVKLLINFKRLMGLVEGTEQSPKLTIIQGGQSESLGIRRLRLNMKLYDKFRGLKGKPKGF